MVEENTFKTKEEILEPYVERPFRYTSIVEKDYALKAMEEYAGQLDTAAHINILRNICHQASRDGGWYTDLETGEPLVRNEGEMLCLIHSEISEAMEGIRKDLMDDKLPHRPMAEVELADAIIRICDYAGYKGFDLGGAIMEKIEFNANRADHKIENRKSSNGKKF